MIRRAVSRAISAPFWVRFPSCCGVGSRKRKRPTGWTGEPACRGARQSTRATRPPAPRRSSTTRTPARTSIRRETRSKATDTPPSPRHTRDPAPRLTSSRARREPILVVPPARDDERSAEGARRGPRGAPAAVPAADTALVTPRLPQRAHPRLPRRRSPRPPSPPRCVSTRRPATSRVHRRSHRDRTRAPSRVRSPDTDDRSHCTQIATARASDPAPDAPVADAAPAPPAAVPSPVSPPAPDAAPAKASADEPTPAARDAAPDTAPVPEPAPAATATPDPVSSLVAGAIAKATGGTPSRRRGWIRQL